MTPPSPTGPRGSFWMSPASFPWDGGLAFRWKKAFGRRMRGSRPMWPRRGVRVEVKAEATGKRVDVSAARSGLAVLGLLLADLLALEASLPLGYTVRKL
ncbi:hypothetical protein TO73_0781 [Thermus aquaticus Y51MC23]|uniref:Uncharacterized protein n=1 Tax=Thermus aquaticus (strain ATCC BAA-2747 / Y51MC23) TaxID=498848 RepID=A0ABN4IGE3_THEA5|nr:hypothetical protein TO73_0781 [Thermus aquaticus Y51MC23]